MQQLAYTIPQVCTLSCIGRTTVYHAIKTGALRAVKSGRRTLVLDGDLRAWIEGLRPIRTESNATAGTEDAR